MGEYVEGPVRGNDGLYLSLKQGAGTAEEYDGHIKNIEFTSEDRDDLTFAEVQAGDTKVTGIKITGITSLREGSLYRLLWDNPAATFDAVIGLYGNALASLTQPHYTGTLKNTGRPMPKSEARSGRQREEFEHNLSFESGPDLDTGV